MVRNCPVETGIGRRTLTCSGGFAVPDGTKRRLKLNSTSLLLLRAASFSNAPTEEAAPLELPIIQWQEARLERVWPLFV
jgi:hypothetical protein